MTKFGLFVVLVESLGIPFYYHLKIYWGIVWCILWIVGIIYYETKAKKDFERDHHEFMHNMHKLNLLLLRELRNVADNTNKPNLQPEKENLQQ